jgi:hypothetical protein
MLFVICYQKQKSNSVKGDIFEINNNVVVWRLSNWSPLIFPIRFASNVKYFLLNSWIINKRFVRGKHFVRVWSFRPISLTPTVYFYFLFARLTEINLTLNLLSRINVQFNIPMNSKREVCFDRDSFDKLHFTSLHKRDVIEMYRT